MPKIHRDHFGIYWVKSDAVVQNIPQPAVPNLIVGHLHPCGRSFWLMIRHTELIYYCICSCDKVSNSRLLVDLYRGRSIKRNSRLNSTPWVPLYFIVYSTLEQIIHVVSLHHRFHVLIINLSQEQYKLYWLLLSGLRIICGTLVFSSSPFWQTG